MMGVDRMKLLGLLKFQTVSKVLSTCICPLKVFKIRVFDRHVRIVHMWVIQYIHIMCNDQLRAISTSLQIFIREHISLCWEASISFHC
jgi:hypothetical protein